ncbi:MAG: P-loop NTPase [SAR324 cluster bacterium]|nr:P-loop NTPase [SAR324 cluster bacterium]MBF0351961.1 P-loop NTPase [SAR324 cluster bacterium]
MPTKEVWAVGGGKGGVGKSFLTGNLGIALAQKGYSVVMADMDLGGANLHTCLGINNPEKGLSDFVNREMTTIEDILIPTPINGVRLISGAQDGLDIANPRHAQKLRILKAIQNIDVDYVLLDLGAGTAFNTIDFFLSANSQIIVVVPEPTSIENAYRFIKSAFYRKIRHSSPSSRIRTLVDQVMNRNNQYGIRTPRELLEYLKQQDEEVAEFIDRQANEFRPRLILNQVRSANDIKIGFAMDNACVKYFGIHIDFAGYVEHDEIVWKSVLQRKPVLMNAPDSIVAKRISMICNNLIQNRQLKPQMYYKNP